MKVLLENQHFLDDIRAYNSMTSFGAKVYRSVNCGFGPYVFKVEGQVSHWLGSLCPPADQPPRFLQMYICDTSNEIHNRLNQFTDCEDGRLSEDIVKAIMDILDKHNELVKLFRCARDLCYSTNVPDFSVCLYNSARQVSYDSPAPNRMGAIIHEGTSAAEDFDIVVRCRDGRPQRISKHNSLYMPLQAPLLHIYGDRGWSPTMRLVSNGDRRNKNLTMNMYNSFIIHDMHNSYSITLRCGRLFQQYLVDAYISLEQERLDYILANQNLFRTEYLQGVHDAIAKGDTEGQSVGRRVILPSSFTGGPRYMYKHYHDALAICRVYGNPQFFITFTRNVNWPEIVRYMAQYPALKANDRPDIISRVFQLKVEAFRSFIKHDRLFETVVADLYTIEFQKRGLPHCHMLIWVSAADRITSPENVDHYISTVVPDPNIKADLYKIITESMTHGPCGLAKPSAKCMNGGKCSKSFPKRYQLTTSFDKNGYIHYKRPPNGFSVKKNGIDLDNAYVVPYNRSLCLRFNAHINVEYCGWNMMIKYLFKYISKGSDRIRFKVTQPSLSTTPVQNTLTTATNEIDSFVDGRYICPHEAAWRILNFTIHHRYPAVQVLAVHLENMQNVSLRDRQQLQNVVNNPAVQRTTLTEWFTKNESDPSGQHLRYIDYLPEYKWDGREKRWIRRTQQTVTTIGKLVYIHPSCGETFYLCMLLNHQTGCKIFH
ncbi:uncharacterized protein LOC143611242 [Bidens hawaiensis]|uniref:uncharacterized protein LOC143611242 n=1 Tax=Bidens hawaiensis TaxID=980011 RepID=UPI00404B5D28